MRTSDRARWVTSGRLTRGRHTRGRAEPRPDAGYVTAETAVVIPSLVLLVAMLLWGVMAAAALVQCLDGARVGARAAARGEPPGAVTEAAKAAAPPGAEVELAREGDLVRVRVTARAVGPGPLALALEGEAVAFAEDSLAGPPLGRTSAAARLSATTSGALR